jgi:type IV secretion system protein VirD4
VKAHGDGPSPLETAAFAGMSGLLAVALVVWAIGGISGAVFGDGWVGSGLEEAPAVAQRLPHTLRDPRRAWPPARRDELPGAAGFAAATCLLLAAGACVLRASGRLRGTSGTPARWARVGDLRSLRVRRAGAGRVGLGRLHGRLIAAEPRQSVLVVAPTQTGKTTGLAVPAILEWDGPVLATSVKSDLVRDTLARRRSLGEVRIYDPVAATGLERAGWTPLASSGDWQGARRTAARLAKAAQSSPHLSHDAEFWTQAAGRFLAPLLLAAALGERSMADVAQWIDAEEHEEALDRLTGAGEKAAEAGLLAVVSADERLRSSLYMTASLAIEAYNEPEVLECSASADLTADWLLDGDANTAFLCAPVDEQARLRPLFATLIGEIVATVYARAARTGKPMDRPLLLVLDEAANIAPLHELDQIAATGAGQGLQVVTVVQDLAQIHERWGRKADTIINNHRAVLFGPGMSCARTLEYVSRVLGDAEVAQQSVTSAEEGRRSTTRSTAARPLAPPNALRERRPGSMLLLYGSLPPVVIETRAWFRDRRLRRLVAHGGPDAGQ